MFLYFLASFQNGQLWLVWPKNHLTFPSKYTVPPILPLSTPTAPDLCAPYCFLHHTVRPRSTARIHYGPYGGRETRAHTEGSHKQYPVQKRTRWHLKALLCRAASVGAGKFWYPIRTLGLTHRLLGKWLLGNDVGPFSIWTKLNTGYSLQPKRACQPCATLGTPCRIVGEYCQYGCIRRTRRNWG